MHKQQIESIIKFNIIINSMEKQTLIKIGLTDNEADIYLALLSIGPSLVSKIVEKTRINRTHIYDRLSHLMKKGLVAYVIKNNRKHFYAAEPKRLLRYLEEKQEEIAKEKEEVKSILPKLEKIIPEIKDESVEVYEGKEGLKTILEDIIRSKEDILTYGSEGNFSNVLRFYFKHYLKRLEKTGISMKVLFNYDSSRKPFSWKFAKARYLPKIYKTPTETTIYGEKVTIFILTGSPKVILIKSKTVAESYKRYFNVLWRMGKKR